MGINAAQLRRYVVRPTLERMTMAGPAAERLVMGTIAVESDMGCFVRQMGGPACGIGQMEPATAADLLFRYLNGRDDVARRFQNAFSLINDTKISWQNVPINTILNKLTGDLAFSVAMIRLRYWVDPEPLPSYLDLTGLALYWKRIYNTGQGAGTIADFTTKFKRHLVDCGLYGETGHFSD